MPFTHTAPQWSGSHPTEDYRSLLSQLYKVLYTLNVGTDFVFPDTTDLSQCKLVIVPALYVADDALLERISNYVKGGGHVLMTFQSGSTNENSAVRSEVAPGPLREAAGLHYQEFSNLGKPLGLEGDPLGAGEETR